MIRKEEKEKQINEEEVSEMDLTVSVCRQQGSWEREVGSAKWG